MALMMRRGWRAIAFPAQRYRSAHWLVRGSGIVGCAAHRRRHFFTRGGNGNADDHHGADARTRTHTDEGVLFPYPAALVLHVVTDVANYREFVPWCVGSRVLPDAPAAADAQHNTYAAVPHDGPPPLPRGWTAVASRSRPGKFTYVNDYTGERIAWKPTVPASKTKGNVPRP